MNRIARKKTGAMGKKITTITLPRPHPLYYLATYLRPRATLFTLIENQWIPAVRHLISPPACSTGTVQVLVKRHPYFIHRHPPPPKTSRPSVKGPPRSSTESPPLIDSPKSFSARSRHPRRLDFADDIAVAEYRGCLVCIECYMLS